MARAFKYNRHDINEVCFANNNISDQQFAELLSEMIDNEKVFNDLQRITYGGNNELGLKTMQVLDHLIREKHASFPLTHLALVNCKSHIRTMEPLFITLDSKENHLHSLIIPKQNLGEEGLKVLCKMIRKHPSTLKTLDISWN